MRQNARSIIQGPLALEKLVEDPYASILCYPQPASTEFNRRLKELRGLDVTAIEFVGEKQVSNIPVLGKGCVGIVVLAFRRGKRVALKIRRIDADRSHMRNEAKLLRKANLVQVGPKILAASRNFLCMQYIDGKLLPSWLGQTNNKERVNTALRRLLEQCWQLDRINLDHGELSHAPKHVIVTKKDDPFLVDFESASLIRKPANVTSISQFLFMGSETAEQVAKKLGPKNKTAIAEALKKYKNEKTFGNFCKVLHVCGLQTT